MSALDYPRLIEVAHSFFCTQNDLSVICPESVMESSRTCLWPWGSLRTF